MNLKRSKKRCERSAKTRGRGSFSADAAVATAIVAFILVVLVFGAKASLRSLAGKLEVMEVEKEAILLADRLLKTCELAKCSGYLRSHEIDASKAIRIQAAGSASVRGGASGVRGKASIAIKNLDDAAESAAEGTEDSSAGGEAGGAADKTMQRICSRRVVLLEGEERILEACVER